MVAGLRSCTGLNWSYPAHTSSNKTCLTNSAFHMRLVKVYNRTFHILSKYNFRQWNCLVNLTFVKVSRPIFRTLLHVQMWIFIQLQDFLCHLFGLSFFWSNKWTFYNMTSFAWWYCSENGISNIVQFKWEPSQLALLTIQLTTNNIKTLA